MGFSVLAQGFYDQKIAWIRFQIGLAPVRIGVDNEPAPHAYHVRGKLERSASLGDLEQHICAIGPYEHDVITTAMGLFLVAAPTEKTRLPKLNSQKRTQNRPAYRGNSSVLGEDFSVTCTPKRAEQKYERPSYRQSFPDRM
jgi:hypothetical protein